MRNVGQGVEDQFQLLNPIGREILRCYGQMQRYYALDIMKYLAVFPIIFFHVLSDYILQTTTNIDQAKSLWNIFSNAPFGVEIFFIISGFFVREHYKKYPEEKLQSYVKNRIYRLFPHYIFSILLIGIFSIHYLSGSIFTYQAFVYQFFLLQSVLPDVPGLLLNPYAWYVCVLFYLSIFLFLIFKLKQNNLVLLIMAVATFLSLSICVASSGVSGMHRETFDIGLCKGIVRGMASMGLGYFLSEFKLTINNETKKVNFIIGAVHTALLFCVFAGLWLGFFQSKNYLLLYILFTAYMVVSISNKGFLSQFLAKLNFKNKYGYQLYIYQWFIFGLSYKLGIIEIDFFRANPWVLIVVLALFCYIGSYAFDKIVIWILKKAIN